MPQVSANLSAWSIRRRLAHTDMPSDPMTVTTTVKTGEWPRLLLDELAAPLIPAGVLIPIISREEELSILLTERSPELKHHAGQISFPGGRMEEGDPDVCATALRETHEEVGIDPTEIDVLGYLNTTPTVSGYAVTPVVGLLTSPITPMIDTEEVKSVFEVPLRFLMEQRNQLHSEREFRGVKVPIVEYNYGEFRIWGATAGMLVELRSLLINT